MIFRGGEMILTDVISTTKQYYRAIVITQCHSSEFTVINDILVNLDIYIIN